MADVYYHTYFSFKASQELRNSVLNFLGSRIFFLNNEKKGLPSFRKTKVLRNL